jgi:hypothetical protein
MKTRNFLKVALLLIIAGLGLTSCGKDDKDPEIVTDPIGENVEYYIVGKVVANDAALSDVTITSGDVTVMTDDKGQYSVTVKDKKEYTLSFAKDGYMTITDAQATIASDATNRSMVTLNVTMNKEGVKTTVNPETAITVTEKGEGEQQEATASVTIPAGAVNEVTEISVTPYIAPSNIANESAGTKEEAVAMTNIVIASSKDIKLNEDITLAINNKASNDSFFDEVEVYKKSTARAADDWEKLSDADFDKTSNSYKVTIEKGSSLSGEYSIRVKSTKTVSTIKTNEINKEESKSNAGNMSAINNYSFTYEAKAGWDFTSSVSGVESGMADMIYSTIAAQEGGSAGFYSVPQTVTTNISGDYVMYYLSKAQYVDKDYTFYINGGEAVTVSVKHYVGMEVTYTNQSSKMHSGGEIG